MAVALIVGGGQGRARLPRRRASATGSSRTGRRISMAIAGVAFFLALQAQAGKLPFDIPEADQEIMGGPLVEQSGPRLALFRWALWAKQLVLRVAAGGGVRALAAHVGVAARWTVLLALFKACWSSARWWRSSTSSIPRLRIDQAMCYFLRVAVSSLAALAFAVIGM